jgi:hypothetical protein
MRFPGPGAAVDTFEGAGSEKNARRFEVYGYPFAAENRDKLTRRSSFR